MECKKSVTGLSLCLVRSVKVTVDMQLPFSHSSRSRTWSDHGTSFSLFSYRIIDTSNLLPLKVPSGKISILFLPRSICCKNCQRSKKQELFDADGIDVMLFLYKIVLQDTACLLLQGSPCSKCNCSSHSGALNDSAYRMVLRSIAKHWS